MAAEKTRPRHSPGRIATKPAEPEKAVQSITLDEFRQEPTKPETPKNRRKPPKR